MNHKLNIAFISYEYPPETGGGGIGTYLVNVIPELRKAGHNAILITATNKPTSFWENDFIFKVPCLHANNFNEVLMPYFKKLHDEIKFDVVEATDFSAWGLSIKKAFPLLPFIVKLHTPRYLVDTLHFKPLKSLNY